MVDYSVVYANTIPSLNIIPLVSKIIFPMYFTNYSVRRHKHNYGKLFHVVQDYSFCSSSVIHCSIKITSFVSGDYSLCI
jgi:hypothetical protein